MRNDSLEDLTKDERKELYVLMKGVPDRPFRKPPPSGYTEEEWKGMNHHERRAARIHHKRNQEEPETEAIPSDDQEPMTDQLESQEQSGAQDKQTASPNILMNHRGRLDPQGRITNESLTDNVREVMLNVSPHDMNRWMWRQIMEVMLDYFDSRQDATTRGIVQELLDYVGVTTVDLVIQSRDEIMDELRLLWRESKPPIPRWED